MKTNALRAGWLLLVYLLMSNTAQAITPPKKIERAVERHMQRLLAQHRATGASHQRVDFDIARIDPNLRLASCSRPLSLQSNGDRLLGRITIRVRCEDSTPWQIYVPVSVKAFQKVVTAAIPLRREQRLDASMLRLTDTEVSRLTQGFYTDLEAVIGKSLKRPVQVNTPLQPNMVIEPLLVEKGDEVVIVAKSGPLSVKSFGIALTKGRKGEQIQVRNKSSKRIVLGRVISSEAVQVVL